MLRFKETEEYYVITEIIMDWYSDSVKTIKYSKDLKMVQVSDDPWRKTEPAQRQWFKDHYMKHFKGGSNESSLD